MVTLIATVWLRLKAIASRRIDFGRFRKPLPGFLTPDDVANYLMKRFRYVPDPMSGLLDYYTHPETIEWMLSQASKDWRFSCDCDDYAVYAYCALSQMPGIRSRIVTLVDPGIKWSHVVCAFRDANGQLGVIDTNGLVRLDVLPALEDQAMMRHFGQLYGCTYTAALTTPYPFGSR